MSTFTKWSLTLTGIFLILTELAGDIPGAMLGISLIAFAWLPSKKS